MMNIVLFGASGFIGRRVAQILRAHGDTLRTPSHREFDYLQPNEAAAREILRGADAVFNCIGVMSRHADVLETVHHRTPALLAKIAAEQGVRHWVQLSALGADPKHTTMPTLSSNVKFANFYPLSDLDRIAPRPLLFITGDAAQSKIFSEMAYQAAGEPKELYYVKGASHTDMYDNADKIPFAKLVEFYRAQLQ